MPDLDAAAPLIDAIFGTAPKERALPYALCGGARSRVNAPARSLLQLLALASSRCTASALFALLQQDCVARRFGLDEHALAQVHGWLLEAGFHWGLDAPHRARFELPATPRHTLADALQRLFLGYALPQAHGAAFDGLIGAGAAEGSRALALGALWRFALALQRLHADLQRPRHARGLGRHAVRAARRLPGADRGRAGRPSRAAPDAAPAGRRHARRRCHRSAAAGGGARRTASPAGRPGARRRGRRQRQLCLDEQPARAALRRGLRHRLERRRLSRHGAAAGIRPDGASSRAAATAGAATTSAA